MRIRIAHITPDTPAHAAGLVAGDEIVRVGGFAPTDVFAYSRLAAEPGTLVDLVDGRQVSAAALSGATLEEAVFDDVRTCNNRCAFCFVRQLPKGMRKSLYVRDDDYRLSALYGNFTTLTRFGEVDFERVIEERISPLYVSIHATDPQIRAKMLQNPKGIATLRWLRRLLDAEIDVHGQIVLCPGMNDADILEGTLAELIADYQELQSVGVVPLGVSRFNARPELRPLTAADALHALETIHASQTTAMAMLGRRFVFAADELYLLADEPFPPATAYEGFSQHANGIGMARSLQKDAMLAMQHDLPMGNAHPSGLGRIALLTGELGARVLEPIVRALPVPTTHVEIWPVRNRFFGGNIGVTGLLTGQDISESLLAMDPTLEPVLPDVVFANGKTLDDWPVSALTATVGRNVRIVPTDAAGLRMAVGL